MTYRGKKLVPRTIKSRQEVKEIRSFSSLLKKILSIVKLEKWGEKKFSKN